MKSMQRVASCFIALLIVSPPPIFANPGMTRGPANRSVASGSPVSGINPLTLSVADNFQGALTQAPSLLGTLPVLGETLPLPESSSAALAIQRFAPAAPATVNEAAQEIHRGQKKLARVSGHALNAADDDLPATLSENSPEGRKRRSARHQLEIFSQEDAPNTLWDNTPKRQDSEPIRIVPADKKRFRSYLRYKKLQLSVANFYLGNRLRKQYQILQDARDAVRATPSAVENQTGLYIEARTKGLAGRIYPLGLDILNREALVNDSNALFNKFFDVDALTQQAWKDYVLVALASPRAKIPSQLKKALFGILQDASTVPNAELADFFDERRWRLQGQGSHLLSFREQKKMIKTLKIAVSRAVTEINTTLAPGKRLIGISLLGSYVTRTARSDSDMDFHVISEDGAQSSRARFVERLAEIWEKMGRTEELGAFQYALPSHAGLIFKVYEKPGNMPYRVLSPYAGVEKALTANRSADRWSGAAHDLYARLFELSFRTAARVSFLWWDFKYWIANNMRASWRYHSLQLESINFFFGHRASGLRTKIAKWQKENDALTTPSVTDLTGLMLHWRAEAYTGLMRPLGPQVSDRRAVEEAALRIWDRYYPQDPASRAAFVRYIARVKRVAPSGRPSYFRKQIFQVFYDTPRIEATHLIAHIDAMLDDDAVDAKLKYGRTMTTKVQQTFRSVVLHAIKATNKQVAYEKEVVAVVLLGSYATGTPGPSSDLDYMVVTRDGSKTSLKLFIETVEEGWRLTEFHKSPLGPFKYAVPPVRRLMERTHAEGYLVFSDEPGVALHLASPPPSDREAVMPAWKRIGGRLFAEFWKLYLRTYFAYLDLRQPRDPSSN
ncbi:MAG: hypothetical protein COB53_06375 [Elusimicrobia bacterium]|nr:MAG: hypothetical protein COB53_06375 [Elusimicrobiota bacterium]